MSEQQQQPSLKDQIAAANDELARIKRGMYRGETTLDDARAAAQRVLELRQQAELKFYGRIKTKITPIAIAHLTR